MECGLSPQADPQLILNLVDDRKDLRQKVKLLLPQLNSRSRPVQQDRNASTRASENG
jgi:hypothetical protein